MGANRVRVAVIGCGSRGISHLRPLSEFADVEIIAVCDPVEVSLQRVVDEFGMTWSDGSYNLWCSEALETLSGVDRELEAALEQGFVARAGRWMRRWAT